MTNLDTRPVKRETRTMDPLAQHGGSAMKGISIIVMGAFLVTMALIQTFAR